MEELIMRALENCEPKEYFIILRKSAKSLTAQETQNRSVIIW